MALETGLIFARKVLCSYSVIIKKSAIFRFSEWELFSKLRGNHKSRIKSSYAYDHLLWVFLCGDHPDLPQMMIIHGKQLGRKGNIWSQGREKRHHSYKREKSVKSNLARFPTHPSSEAVAGFGGFCWPRNGLLKRHAKIMWQSLICIEKCSPLEIFGGPQVFFLTIFVCRWWMASKMWDLQFSFRRSWLFFSFQHTHSVFKFGGRGQDQPVFQLLE